MQDTRRQVVPGSTESKWRNGLDRNLHTLPPEYDAEPIMVLDQPKLIEMLKDPGSTMFQKAKACQRLATIGTKEAVPALAALLGDDKLGTYARFGLEPIPDPAADDALRDAMKGLKGRLLAGVVNSLGQRKDPKAVEPLSKLLYGSDAEVAQCAAAALGRISGPQAAKALQDGLTRTKGPVRDAVARGSITCASGLMARGDRKQALALYELLSRPDVIKPVRMAAMHSIIAAETSITRPKTNVSVVPRA